MERSPVAFDQNFSGAAGDFPALLRDKGLLAPAAANPLPQAGTPQKTWQPTEATTILAFKFSGGVLVAGDRRATAGNTVVYDRADKVLEIDRHSIMAIAGVPATAWEMARVHRTLVSIFSANAATGNERRRQSTRSVQAAT